MRTTDRVREDAARHLERILACSRSAAESMAAAMGEDAVLLPRVPARDLIDRVRDMDLADER